MIGFHVLREFRVTSVWSVSCVSSLLYLVGHVSASVRVSRQETRGSHRSCVEYGISLCNSYGTITSSSNVPIGMNTSTHHVSDFGSWERLFAC